jgi:hypothetical protein
MRHPCSERIWPPVHRDRRSRATRPLLIGDDVVLATFDLDQVAELDIELLCRG